MMSNFADKILSENIASQSNSVLRGPVIPALLAIAAGPALFSDNAIATDSFHGSSPTNDSGLVWLDVLDSDIIRLFDSVMNDLLNEEVVLDETEQSALYRNRWDLYD